MGTSGRAPFLNTDTTMLTASKQTKALSILREHPGVTANTFAAFYFTDPSQETLFTAVSNQGNGACAGKSLALRRVPPRQTRQKGTRQKGLRLRNGTVLPDL